jgi:hypothetical protein
MSCSINRYKFVGSSCTKKETTEDAKELEARMKEMLEIRAAQDKGEFKKVELPQSRSIMQPQPQSQPQPTVRTGGTVLFKSE